MQISPLEWADLGIILDDPYTIFLRDLVEFPDGERRGYLRLINRADLHNGQGVAVLPLLGKKIVLLKDISSCHPQLALGDSAWDMVDPKTSAEENAKKELEEEMGARVKTLEDLGDYHINTGIDAGVVRLFLAYLTSLGNPEDKEGIKEFVEVGQC